MRRREFLVVGASRADALLCCRRTLLAYIAGRRFRYVIKPEAQRYVGRSKVLAGKWRAYVRVEVIE